MFFSQEWGPALKKTQPYLAFCDVAKAIGKSYVPDPYAEKKKKKKEEVQEKGPERAQASQDVLHVCYAVTHRPELVKSDPKWDFVKFGKTIGDEWRLCRK